MSAEIVLGIWDALLPAALVALMYKLGVKLKKAELQLTQKEKDMLQPILEKCLATINMTFNSPWEALGMTILVIYGSKVGEKSVIDIIDRKREKDATEQPAAATPDAPKQQAPQAADFSEDLINRCMKKRKVGRDRAILILSTMKKENKPLTFDK